MAPSRGKGKTRAASRAGPPSGNGLPLNRTTRNGRGGTRDVYEDMVAEAVTTDPSDGGSDRPLKRRRVAKKTATPARDESIAAQTRMPSKTDRMQQIVENSSDSDDDESDFAFEDVDLEQEVSSPQNGEADHDAAIGDVSISVDAAPKRPIRTQRRPPTTAEKAYRLIVHKSHVLCLFVHCMSINGWCNNLVVQRHLRSLLPTKVITFLNPKPEDSQFRQTESFLDGLQQASDVFHGKFKITASGMRACQWEDGSDAASTDPMDRSDFIRAAASLKGSQDTGNQLFCALLRASGVEARLACSMQPLPLINQSGKVSTPQKTEKRVVYAMTPGMRSPTNGSDLEDHTVGTSASIGKVPSARRRLGQPTFTTEAAPSPKPRKSFQKLAFPVFWVEAFNPAHQKWIAVDPVVTQTVGKPSKLEPPSSYTANQLSYVIAFESDGVAKDVTRRYARAFNAKTRRKRVESTENGSAWLKKAIRFFRRSGGALDRDQVEEAELAQREAREGLPGNVLDFKDHPYYALERHLKRHEVIHPKREAGKVNAGTAAKPRMEAVFRRQDVLKCQSADKWFRVGREIKEGEQPVKRVIARRPRRARSPSAEDGLEDGEDHMTPLYAPFQTKAYIPRPVVNGKVPRNAYGNLDIYVPSMVPAGGVHVRHPLAQEAARTVRADFVDAVVGFQFKGRQGTAIKEGIIVPSEFEHAIQAVIEGLGDEKTEEESRTRSAVALKMWKRFMVALRIQERVSTYGRYEETDEDPMDVDEAEDDIRDHEAGGFLPSDAPDAELLPTAGRFSLVELSTAARKPKREKKRGGFEEGEEEVDLTVDGTDEDEQMTYQPSSRSLRARRRVVEEDETTEVHESNHESTVTTTTDHLENTSHNDLTEEEGVGRGFVAEDEGTGGGFLEDDDKDARGTLPDASSNTVDYGHGCGSTNIADEHGARMEDDVSGGFLMDTKDEESTTLTTDSKQQAEIDTSTQQAVGEEQDHVDSAPSPVPAIDKLSHAKDDESDQDSMLSHDPDDDDAEPDWLESD